MEENHLYLKPDRGLSACDPNYDLTLQYKMTPEFNPSQPVFPTNYYHTSNAMPNLTLTPDESNSSIHNDQGQTSKAVVENEQITSSSKSVVAIKVEPDIYLLDNAQDQSQDTKKVSSLVKVFFDFLY